MTEGRLIQAALTAPDAAALLAQYLPERSRPWLDDLQPIGLASPAASAQQVYRFVDIGSLIVAHLRLRPAIDDELSAKLFCVAMPASDRDRPWPHRRLSVVPMADLYHGGGR